MARRKDHSPEELKDMILQSAKYIICSKGLVGLTARALARHVGYTAGTIYNFYRDMDALIAEVNYTTLCELSTYAQERLAAAKPGYQSVQALAYAYIDFARDHERAWRTLFIETNRSTRAVKMPAHYQTCLGGLFQLIEKTLQDNLRMSADEAAQAARILWASLHGVTSLMLDGRLNLIGIKDPHEMVDDLLKKYLKL